MTDGAPHHYPPPGAPQPTEAPVGAAGGPPPGWGAPPGAGTSYAPYVSPGRGPGGLPGMLGAAHKPGAFPLRPLTLGNMYDGAFRIIRFNPKATVGAAVMVTAVAMVIPVLITTILTFTVGVAIDASGETSPEAGIVEVLSVLAAYGSLLLSLVLAQVGVVFVTGMIAHVTRAAAVGKRLSLGEAWAATHGKRWRLLGLTFLINLAFVALVVAYVLLWVVVVLVAQDAWPVILAWGLISVPAFICLCCWLWIRAYYLPVPPLMLENVGVFGAIGRGWTLTARQFWRTFGIALLTVLIGSVAGTMLSTPVSLVGQIGALAVPEYAALLLVLTQAIALVAQNAFVAPFLSTVASVQYVDLRMRKEAFDVDLMREVGIATE
ncbi:MULTISPECIES: hypothetical protein [Nocardioides]|uniref:Glycerophosphoryl diester phosphodiesterase membrane domain-containing protein n=1 Tax=Nocardioides vastitatis TaxID=2568655 RepID=A0ABW0ZI18_9ACTN|nr:hypothetical protein [Nocardioides sp.]THJ06156.1 hypothetical protein E7Z54_06620 [Nocardioides sp.]